MRQSELVSAWLSRTRQRTCTSPASSLSRIHCLRRQWRKWRRIPVASRLKSHTHPFNGPLSETTRVSRYQKGKANLDFTEARDSEWPWHQLGHMQVCTSLQPDNHASTPSLSFLQAGCPSCRPTDSVKALKAARLKSPHYDTIPPEVDHATDVRMYLNLVHVHTTTYTGRQKKKEPIFFWVHLF